MSRFMESLTCRYHPDAVLIEDCRAGDLICPMCGLVVGERMIDVSTEWRTFNDESDTKSMDRVGAAQNLLYDHENLETTTSVGKSAQARDETGRPKYDKKLGQISSADKTLQAAHSAIRTMASRINLSKKVTDRAFLTFKICSEKKYSRGRSQDAIIAACIYIACREEGSARTMDEIASISSVSSLEISRVYRKLVSLLPKATAPKSISIRDLMPRFCNRLNLQEKMLIERTAIHIVERANEICDIQGRKPSSIAGASIYLACLAAREDISKKDIHQSTGASQVVIRDVYRILLSRASQLFPSDFQFKRLISDLPSN